MDAKEIRDVAAEKARARGLFRERRAMLSPEARAEESERICSRVLPLIQAREARTVSAFWPLAEEVDLRPLILTLAGSGVHFALPVVASAPGAAPRLEHRVFKGERALARGPFGVMQPLATAPLVTPERIDLALVPALALDARGTRLGYGGGFYDAFLAQTQALRVGVVFACGVTETLHAEPHDARVDVVVSPEAMSPTGRSRNPEWPEP